MSQEKIDKKTLFSLFEAARWAPSSYNNQPWRFLYGMQGTKEFSLLFSLLVEFNQSWCKKASALVLVISKTTFENNKPSPTHSFDTGAAVENLALQGTLLNLVVHCMQGFDYVRARKELLIPPEYQVEAMIAVGVPGKKEDLPEDLQKKEIPSQRKSLEELAIEGAFAFVRKEKVEQA